MSFLGGFDAEKALLSRDGIGRELEEIRKGKISFSLRRGIVLEYLASQGAIGGDMINRLVKAGAERVQVLKAPPNSLAVIPIDEGVAHLHRQVIICYPFFPFIQFPAKPGEMVWFTTGNDLDPSPNAAAWWMSRVTLPDQSENPNYAHHDRQYWDPAETGYPNGSGSDASFTLPGDIDSFNDIVMQSGAMRGFVPRGVRRPIPNINRTSLVGSHGNGIIMDVVNESPAVEIFAGTPRPATRISDRGWEEMDPTRTTSEAGERAPLTAQAKVGIYENAVHPERLYRIQEPQVVTGFNGKVTNKEPGPLAAQFSQGASISVGNQWAGVFGGGSSFTLQQNQAALEANRTLINSRDVIILPNAESSLSIGGIEEQQNMILGNNLNAWLTNLADTLDTFVSAVANAKIPSPVGPLDVGTGITDGGTIFDIALQVQDAIQQAKNDLPKHLSSVASIVNHSVADSEE